MTTGEPWLPIGDEIAQRNVASEQDDEHSILRLYRHLIRLRRQGAALVAGRFEPQRSQGDVLLFEHLLDSRSLLIALNTSDREHSVQIRERRTVRVSTHLDRGGETIQSTLWLRAAEGVILEPV